MPTIYQTNIRYNEEQDINEYLERYGAEILYALTAWDTTTSEAIDQMIAAYGKLPVKRWVRRHSNIWNAVKENYHE